MIRGELKRLLDELVEVAQQWQVAPDGSDAERRAEAKTDQLEREILDRCCK